MRLTDAGDIELVLQQTVPATAKIELSARLGDGRSVLLSTAEHERNRLLATLPRPTEPVQVVSLSAEHGALDVTINLNELAALPPGAPAEWREGEFWLLPHGRPRRRFNQVRGWLGF